MSPDREQQQQQQQRDANQQQSANRSSGTTGTATQSANTTDTRNEGRAEAGRGDQERAIQTGREGSRSTGVGRRGQTSPVYGSGASLTTPFMLMRRMADDMDRLFENFGLGSTGFGLSPLLGTGSGRDLWGESSSSRAVAQSWTPQIETFRRGDKLVVRADLPGLKKDDVKVEIENGVLSISGERRDQYEEDRDGYYRSERSYGQFYRALSLPEGVSDEQCEATFKDGVLEVTLAAPKEEDRKAKQVPIR
jgi:HSP20 family protein